MKFKPDVYETRTVNSAAMMDLMHCRVQNLLLLGVCILTPTATQMRLGSLTN